MKRCSVCGEILELNADNFYRAARQSDGFVAACKPCTAKRVAERKNRVIEIKEEVIKGAEPKIYDNGGMYKVINNVKAPGSASRLYKSEFNGEVIYQDKRLLTLKNDRGLRETFLKVDFEIGEYQIQSV